MRYTILLLFLAALCSSAFSQKNDFKIIAYFSGSAANVDKYDANQFTHIIHCFSHLKGNQLDIGNANSVATLKKLVNLKKKNPDLKVLLSLGGWGGCYTCSDVFSTGENRKAFALSVKKELEKYGADGIDLDWEYPAVEGPPGHPYKPEDRENFTDLIRLLRETLGTKYIVSFAAGGFEKFFEDAVEWEKVAPMLDFINLMSYDLVNGYSTVTGHHTPLYSTSENPFSVDYGLKQMMSRGVPAEKIIVGLAFYGRVWENVPDQNNGLYQSGKFKNSPSIIQIDKLKTNPDYSFFWDDTAMAPYAYSAKQGLYYTWDDKRSVGLKTRYALDNNLGGVMFWQLGLDYPKDGLLDEINKTAKSAGMKFGIRDSKFGIRD